MGRTPDSAPANHFKLRSREQPGRPELEKFDSGAVRLVGGLEAGGLVERPSGRLWATSAGGGTASKILAARAELLEPVLARTSKGGSKTVTAFLETALAELTDSRDRALSICRLSAEGTCQPLGCPVELAASRTDS